MITKWSDHIPNLSKNLIEKKFEDILYIDSVYWIIYIFFIYIYVLETFEYLMR